MVKRSMHIGGSSPFNKKERVIKEWPMCNWAITVSPFLFVRGQIIHCFKAGYILCCFGRKKSRLWREGKDDRKIDLAGRVVTKKSE